MHIVHGLLRFRSGKMVANSSHISHGIITGTGDFLSADGTPDKDK